ncbi:EscU/YscU/HrcU family type III secretion system export apparatus switch protein [Alkalihalobacillus sp. LMS39]|uniref:EscU/YscU/HrcU family type III secretion system export apparatus switch protein n=1 Tax=Alkalihalobacillus sp. LMS39 TaxID=2924032 RepID=UPI001FB2F31D|nr:EscU/YscU/HrcU family type III secretion system export apparatus switch protein [Alkalihalobacillus sp. LMS39]UOE92857.1 EscU/YscU/HrcU family type III secretion system export apparatus switch protein [Alkalihalobacillus sp. LMS39]
MRKETLKKQAIALRYDDKKDQAPKVIAKGKGLVADEIIAKAKEHQLPIQEDPNLVELLSKLEINETIPVELYEVVAEVFAFVYQIDKQHS